MSKASGAKKKIDWQRQSSRALTSLGLFLIPLLGVWYYYTGRGMDQRYFFAMVLGHSLMLLGGFLGRFKQVFFYAAGLGIGLFFIGLTLDDQATSRDRRRLCEEIRQDRFCVSSSEGFTCREPGRLGNFWIAHTECPTD